MALMRRLRLHEEGFQIALANPALLPGFDPSQSNTAFSLMISRAAVCFGVSHSSNISGHLLGVQDIAEQIPHRSGRPMSAPFC